MNYIGTLPKFMQIHTQIDNEICVRKNTCQNACLFNCIKSVMLKRANVYNNECM